MATASISLFTEHEVCIRKFMYCMEDSGKMFSIQLTSKWRLTAPCNLFVSSMRRSSCPAPDFEIAACKDHTSSVLQ